MYEENYDQDINTLYVRADGIDCRLYDVEAELKSIKADEYRSISVMEDALEVFRNQIEKQLLCSFSQLRDLFKEHFENGEAEITDEELRQILLW